MKDKALTNLILAAALSTTLFQLSGGFWIAQVIVISILGARGKDDMLPITKTR